MPPLSNPHQGRAQALLGASVLLLVLPYPFVILRLWSRHLKKQRLNMNDYLLISALIFTSGYNIAMIVASISGGYGQRIATLSLDEIETNLQLTIAATLLWPTANSLIKLSVLHFYKTIFPNPRVVFAIYCAAALTMAYWISTFFLGIFICRPFEYHWNKMLPGGTCGDLLAYYLSTAIVNLLIDVIIVVLPLPVLGSLHLPTSRKASLIVIFSLGGLICFISVARVVAIKKLDFTDVTYNIVLDNILTALEPTLGVINACLPLLQPVVSKMSGVQFSTWLRSFRSMKTSERRLTVPTSKQHSTDDRSDHFHRLTPDLYPLTNLSVTQTSRHSMEER